MYAELNGQLAEKTRQHIDQAANHHEKELLEEALRRKPKDFHTLVRLGELYSHLRQVKEGLGVDLQLVAMAPSDPIVRYNLACPLALSEKPSAACTALRESVRLGYSDLDHLLKDHDLDSIRENELFEELLRTLRRRRRRRH